MNPSRIVHIIGATDIEPEKEIVTETISSMFLRAVSYSGVILGEEELDDETGVSEADLVILLVWQEFPKQVDLECKAAIAANRPTLVFEKMLKGTEQRTEELTNFLGELVSEANASGFSKLQVRHYGQFRRLSDLREGLEEGVAAEIQRQLKYTVDFARSREEMYLLGTRIARAARRRLYVVQQTPILLLGAREYTDPGDQKSYYEKMYLDALEDWIRSCLGSVSRRFRYLYEIKATRNEIEKFGIQENVRNNLIRYRELQKRSRYGFLMSPITEEYSGPMTVGDSEFAFWIRGRHDANAISFAHDELCDTVARTLETLAGRTSLAEEMKLLGLSNEL